MTDNISSTTETIEFADQGAAIASLNHARKMLIHASELRAKNFNFFLIAAGGIIVAAFTKSYQPPVIWVAGTAGLMLSAIFLILDIRTLQLIKDARHDLERIEPKFGISIHTVDQLPDRSRGKSGSSRCRLISHTFGFQSVFIMMAILSALALFCGVDFMQKYMLYLPIHQ